MTAIVHHVVPDGRCVICDRRMPDSAKHLDTCSERCYQRLLRQQRQRNRPSPAEAYLPGGDEYDAFMGDG